MVTAESRYPTPGWPRVGLRRLHAPEIGVSLSHGDVSHDDVMRSRSVMFATLVPRRLLG